MMLSHDVYKNSHVYLTKLPPPRTEPFSSLWIGRTESVVQNISTQNLILKTERKALKLNSTADVHICLLTELSDNSFSNSFWTSCYNCNFSFVSQLGSGHRFCRKSSDSNAWDTWFCCSLYSYTDKKSSKPRVINPQFTDTILLQIYFQPFQKAFQKRLGT